jgi:hypothetical protein
VLVIDLLCGYYLFWMTFTARQLYDTSHVDLRTENMCGFNQRRVSDLKFGIDHFTSWAGVIHWSCEGIKN